MKTVLITGASPVPEALREILERGSTAIEPRRAAASEAGALAAARPDRVVFWEAAADDAVASLARNCAAREDLRQAIVFVAARPELTPASLAPDQVFVWPSDEDRLRMAFLTGA